MALKKFIIERDIPGVGALTEDQLSGAAATSNDALCKIGAADIQRRAAQARAGHPMGRELLCGRQDLLRLPCQG